MIEQRDNKWVHTTQIEVRDYELDSEGIVNNAIYLHYLEHARHLFCIEAGLSFAAMREREMMPVVSRLEVDYRIPLTSGDTAHCELWVTRRGPRFIFNQIIYNDRGEVSVQARVIIVTLLKGKLSRGDELVEVFAKFLSDAQ